MQNERPIATTLTLESRGLVVSLRVELPGNTVPFVDESGRFDLQTSAEETLPIALAKEAPALLRQILESVEGSLLDRKSADVSSVALKYILRDAVCEQPSTEVAK